MGDLWAQAREELFRKQRMLCCTVGDETRPVPPAIQTLQRERQLWVAKMRHDIDVEREQARLERAEPRRPLFPYQPCDTDYRQAVLKFDAFAVPVIAPANSSSHVDHPDKESSFMSHLVPEKPVLQTQEKVPSMSITSPLPAHRQPAEPAIK